MIKIPHKYVALVRSGLFLTLSLVTVIFVLVLEANLSLSWFADNRQVTAQDGTISAKSKDFELTVSGEQLSPYPTDAPIVTYLGTNGGYRLFNQTNPSDSAIFCHMINENPHIPDSEEIAPGAYGRITFDILPKNNDVRYYVISLSFLSLGENSGPQPVDQMDADTVATLLSGHILFFETRSAYVNDGYYYSNMIEDDVLVYDTQAHTPTTQDGVDHYRVEFYWIWPVTFAQFALQENSPRLHAHAIFQTEAERSAMLAYISTHTDKFFTNTTGVAFTETNYEEYYFVELSDSYNIADQFIGDRVHYCIVCAEVTTAMSIP